jgi:hypothetical protein
MIRSHSGICRSARATLTGQSGELRGSSGERWVTEEVLMRGPGARVPRHYHLIDYQIGDSRGFNDDLFRSQRAAVRAARERAEWLATVGGFEVHALDGVGRYLVKTRRAYDAGRTIEVEACDDPECEAPTYNRMS